MRPLKFKEIRKSIISEKENVYGNLSPQNSFLKKNLFGRNENETELSFTSLQKCTKSPLKLIQLNEDFSANGKRKIGFD
jgi:hypothetical protein